MLWFKIELSGECFVTAGADEKLIEELSHDAKDRIAVGISSFTAMKNQLVEGNIKISLLKIILERRDAFLELLKIGKNCTFFSKDVLICI